ncbi:MAG: amidohydrolase family protein [Rhizobiaceae bacterium]
MIELLDTHQHLLYRGDLAYAWADNLTPLAGRDFTVADYQRLTEDRNVLGTIFMEVDADDYRTETRFVSKLASDPANRILGLISSCRPETDDGFDAWLDECATLPVVGYRRILHEVPDEMSQNETFRRNVRTIGRRGKSFDIVFRADQLDTAYDLGASCDEMTLILNHCGVPDIAGGEIANWKAAISRIASLPHVMGKLSGILAYCAEESVNLEAVRPYVDHMIESFSPSRLVWGSDWPVVNLKSTLPEWIDIFRNLIEDLSADEKAAISSGNAQRNYDVTP